MDVSSQRVCHELLTWECDAPDCDGLWLWADEAQSDFIDGSSVECVGDGSRRYAYFACGLSDAWVCYAANADDDGFYHDDQIGADVASSMRPMASVVVTLISSTAIWRSG